MTERYAEKHRARMRAREYGISYRAALAELRSNRMRAAAAAPYVHRLLIEAVEGCGIRHWARVDAWDGAESVEIADLGGESYRLSVESLSSAVADCLAAGVVENPLDIDSYLADEIIQSVLFGGVIYRMGVGGRPARSA